MEKGDKKRERESERQRDKAMENKDGDREIALYCVGRHVNLSGLLCTLKCYNVWILALLEAALRRCEGSVGDGGAAVAGNIFDVLWGHSFGFFTV